MPQANREYRDRLFKFIFGNPENRDWTLSLYNAINGSSYTDASQIRYTTIEDAVYMNMKNDVSFLVADTMSFYEQQASFNPNMPMRFLIYAGMVYAKYISQTGSYHPYSTAQQKAPTPRCVCFYNGEAAKEDRVVLSLKDAFAQEADIEVRVTMLNVNYGRNKALMDACQPLREYASFVSSVRQKQAILNDFDAAVDAALNEMPEESALRAFMTANRAEVKRMCITEYNEVKFMTANRAEVKRMCITEYNEVKTLADEREEGRMEGLMEGRTEGRVEGTLATLLSLVHKGLLSEERAAEEAHMSVAEFQERAKLA